MRVNVRLAYIHPHHLPTTGKDEEATMQTEADRIATAIQRIRDGAMLRPAGQRAGYVAENIRRQQDQASRFMAMRNPPSSW
jgi:hypothetical protein